MKSGYSFWVEWMLLTLLGFFVSLLFIEVGEKPDLGFFQGALGGAIVGLAQAFTIRESPSLAGKWVIASLVSWGLVGALGLGAIGWTVPRTADIALRVVYGVQEGTLIGAVIGVGQWLVLKPHFPDGWRWIVFSSLGWGIGLSYGWVLGGIWRQITHLFLSELVGLVMAWLIVSVVTGAAMAKLLRGTAILKLSS